MLTYGVKNPLNDITLAKYGRICIDWKSCYDFYRSKNIYINKQKQRKLKAFNDCPTKRRFQFEIDHHKQKKSDLKLKSLPKRG